MAGYHYVAYEELVGPKSADLLLAVLKFIMPASATGLLNPQLSDASSIHPTEHALQQIHDGRCSHRVMNWDKIRAQLKSTITAAACDKLETLASVFKQTEVATSATEVPFKNPPSSDNGGGRGSKVNPSEAELAKIVAAFEPLVDKPNLLKPMVRAHPDASLADERGRVQK